MAIGDMNLWHSKLSEHRMNHQRGRKEEKKGPSPATSSSSGGGGDRAAVLGVNGARAREKERVGAKREEAREMPGFYTGRERGKGKRKGASGRRPCH
jgi:hypothetical protein